VRYGYPGTRLYRECGSSGAVGKHSSAKEPYRNQWPWCTGVALNDAVRRSGVAARGPDRFREEARIFITLSL
jgi:hypothetical protein